MVIADTGFWLALANRRDGDHRAARQALEKIQEALITTWPVLTETCHLLLHRMGHHSLMAFMASWDKGAFILYPLTLDQAPRLERLMQKYSDLPMDLADASLVILAEHLGHGRILSTDRRDFGAYRFKERRPFQNLLFT